ncbi:MAG TPA: hypothetical protein VNH22_11495 [Blastocatellia bacterium]|nr:hypothetical protein [Blastocatellia bacterium]
MAWLNRLQLPLLTAGLVLAAFLLFRFAIDFSAQMSPLIAGPFWLLALATLLVAGANLAQGSRYRHRGLAERARPYLLWAIPLGFIASSLDCMGLTLWGCTRGCSVIKLGIIPAIALTCAAYNRGRRPWMLTAIVALSFAALVPHCLCYNAGNGWWIDRLGASPVCYVWGFAVTLVAVAALRTGALILPSLALCASIVGGSLAFFVGHHFFHFPW